VNKRTEEITVAAKFEGRPLRISDLRNLAVDYQEEHKKATSTLNNMRGSFRRILGFEGDRNAKPLPALLDDLKLVDIRRQHIIDLRKALGKAFSPNTVRGTLGMFKLAWEILHSEREDYTHLPNPLKGKHTKVVVKDRRVKFLSDDQVLALFDAAADGRNPDLYVPLITLCLGAGLRISEAIQLRVCDVVEDEEGEVFINVCPEEHEGDHDMEGKSFHATRPLYLDPDVVEALRPRIAAAKLMKTPWLFFSPDNPSSPITPASYGDYARVTWADAGIHIQGEGKESKWHSLRHTFAANLLTAGVQLKTLSGLLGHANIGITDQYYGWMVPEEASKVTCRLSGDLLRRVAAA